jgi:type I restriction enzyme M protein
VIFIDASREYQEGKKQHKLRDTDLQKIVRTYQHREALQKYSAIVNLEQIEANDFNLNIPRYVDTFEAEAEIDVKAVQGQIDTLEDEWQQARTKMKGFLEELGLV